MGGRAQLWEPAVPAVAPTVSGFLRLGSDSRLGDKPLTPGMGKALGAGSSLLCDTLFPQPESSLPFATGVGSGGAEAWDSPRQTRGRGACDGAGDSGGSSPPQFRQRQRYAPGARTQTHTRTHTHPRARPPTRSRAQSHAASPARPPTHPGAPPATQHAAPRLDPGRRLVCSARAGLPRSARRGLPLGDTRQAALSRPPARSPPGACPQLNVSAAASPSKSRLTARESASEPLPAHPVP